jgi:hypothetical protein
MVSVGAAGTLWTMKGLLGDERRYSQTLTTPDGKESQLRFRRFNESRMERTEDGGKTWLPRNHQVFERLN